MLLLVPVVTFMPNIVTLRTGRLDSGERVGLGFTSDAKFRAVFGAEQAKVWIRVGLLQEMLIPLGIKQIVVDPAEPDCLTGRRSC